MTRLLGLRLASVGAVLCFAFGMSGAFAQDNQPGAAPQDEQPRERMRPSRDMRNVGVAWDRVRSFLESGRLKRIEIPATMRASVRERIRTCRIPILVPETEPMDARFTLVPRENLYSAFYQRDGFTIEIIGTRRARQTSEETQTRDGMTRAARTREELRSRRENRRRGGVVQRTDYGMELSLSLFRVAYNISITCDSPQSDAHCSDETYIHGLVDALAYLGGEPEGGL